MAIMLTLLVIIIALFEDSNSVRDLESLYYKWEVILSIEWTFTLKVLMNFSCEENSFIKYQ
jgi:hypothetical protein